MKQVITLFDVTDYKPLENTAWIAGPGSVFVDDGRSTIAVGGMKVEMMVANTNEAAFKICVGLIKGKLGKRSRLTIVGNGTYKTLADPNGTDPVTRVVVFELDHVLSCK